MKPRVPPMMRHTILTLCLLSSAPAAAQTVETGADTAGQAGNLVGAAISVAMGAQGRIAMLDRDTAVLPVSDHHHVSHRHATAKTAATAGPMGVTFSADVPPDAPPPAATGVSPQDLAAALSSR